MRWQWRMLAAVLWGGLLAQWTWVWFAPPSPATAMQPEQGTNAASGGLFGTAVAQPVVVATANVSVVNARLLGVFTTSRTQPGFAIMQVDGAHQVGVAQGEEVATGVTLAEIHADHVMLERGGVQQKVALEVAPKTVAAVKK
jgi:general secretion pathway protein C